MAAGAAAVARLRHGLEGVENMDRLELLEIQATALTSVSPADDARVCERFEDLLRRAPNNNVAWNALVEHMLRTGSPRQHIVTVLERWLAMARRWRGNAEWVLYRLARQTAEFSRDDRTWSSEAVRRYVDVLVQQPGNGLAATELLALLSELPAADPEVSAQINRLDADEASLAQGVVLLATARTTPTRGGALLQAVDALAHDRGPAEERADAAGRVIRALRTRKRRGNFDWLLEGLTKRLAAIGLRHGDAMAMDTAERLLDIALEARFDPIWWGRRAQLALVRHDAKSATRCLGQIGPRERTDPITARHTEESFFRTTARVTGCSERHRSGRRVVVDADRFAEVHATKTVLRRPADLAVSQAGIEHEVLTHRFVRVQAQASSSPVACVDLREPHHVATDRFPLPAWIDRDVLDQQDVRLLNQHDHPDRLARDGNEHVFPSNLRGVVVVHRSGTAADPLDVHPICALDDVRDPGNVSIARETNDHRGDDRKRPPCCRPPRCCVCSRSTAGTLGWSTYPVRGRSAQAPGRRVLSHRRHRPSGMSGQGDESTCLPATFGEFHSFTSRVARRRSARSPFRRSGCDRLADVGSPGPVRLS
jgi:hypothetical protein